ncbi:hypothetical protein K6Q96_09255 [Grimontia kaedaensis]|uniref:Response regulatory domain-containing protein n=1 Tax=Grimontia kaedaensis TaxID=2872157 RepID=A0ABY4WNH8_9GAMM|nr:hypothetical protein [Grimontia kaedaensis]USH01126.1 hypothetical protein K6Q96_09255 [Grimontia kaedaensis]
MFDFICMYEQYYSHEYMMKPFNLREFIARVNALPQANSKEVIISVDGSPDAKTAFLQHRPTGLVLQFNHRKP